MSAGFGESGLEFQDDPRLTGGTWPPPPPQPEPARTPPGEPAVGQVAPSVAPTGAAHGRLSSWLASQPWYSQPQPAYPDLVMDARHGDWTISSPARVGRLAWLWLPAMAARLGAWSVLRVWMRSDAPRFGERQPPLSAVVADARESLANFERGSLADLELACDYLILRVISQVADYAGRTAVVAGLVALGVTAVAGPGWWWDQISGLLPSFGDSAPSVPHAVPVPAPSPGAGSPVGGPGIASSVVQLLVLGAVLVFVAWRKLRGRGKQTGQMNESLRERLLAEIDKDNTKASPWSRWTKGGK